MRSLRKIAGVLALLIAGAASLLAQTHPVETAFDRKKAAYVLYRDQQINEPWPGDTVHSRFDYLYYTIGDKLVKIRVIESSVSKGKADSIKVDDYFLVDGDLRLVRLYFFISDQRLPLILKGDVVPLVTGEHIEFAGGGLKKWIALNKNIPPTDKRWADKQRSVLLALTVETNRFNDFIETKAGKN